ncbi:MAG: glycosyltransferase [Rhodocyclaceae bacterium]|nr:glycosyltransferase [Rhodocyclaceae bacterium]
MPSAATNPTSITVITVTLNCADSIVETLASVSAQTCRTVEHVVIDGGSTDGTADIVRDFGVAYFVSEPDGGIYQAMEKGVAAATGDVLIFLNAGDVFIDDRVCEEALNYFHNTGTDIVFGDFVPYLLRPSDKFEHPCFVPDRVCRNDQVRDRSCLQNQNIHHQAVFYGRHVFTKCSFFSPEWPDGSDYELNVQALVQHGFTAKYYPRTISKFALGGLSTSNFDRETVQHEKLIELVRNKYFSTAIPFCEDEYIIDSPKTKARPSGLITWLLSPLRLARNLMIAVTGRVRQAMNSRSPDRDDLTDVIADFRMRTDSIYRLASDQHQLLVELHTAIDRIAVQEARIRDLEDSIINLRDLVASSGQEAAGDTVEIISRQETRIRELAKSVTTLHGLVIANERETAKCADEMISRTETLARTAERRHEELAHFGHSVLATLGTMQHAASRFQEATDVNTARLLDARPIDVGSPTQAAYRISSQFDEDGIIQYLTQHIPIPNKVFVEFGVEDYTEANTRLLLLKDNWRGLVLDSSGSHVSTIRSSALYWQHDLSAIAAFVSRENINQLIAGAGIEGDIGLLSVDIDGMDYWVWEAIDIVSPRIVVCEYNAIFGPVDSVVVPYRPDFDRTKAHFSNLYAGASLAALHHLACQKGYSLICSNSAGNNAFFVRDDCLANLEPRWPRDAYVKAQFRESRDADGNLTFLPIEQGIDLIADLPVVDVTTGRHVAIRELGILL